MVLEGGTGEEGGDTEAEASTVQCCKGTEKDEASRAPGSLSANVLERTHP